MKTKDGRDLPVEEITADNYIVPKGEERFFHIKQEVVQYNPKTGAKISRPEIQKYGPKMYRAVVATRLKRFGYELTVLHNPEEWMKQNAAKMAASRAEAERKAKEAAEAKKAAELEAIKEQAKRELLEELKAAGMVVTQPAEAPAEAEAAEAKKPGRPAKSN